MEISVHSAIPTSSGKSVQKSALADSRSESSLHQATVHEAEAVKRMQAADQQVHEKEQEIGLQLGQLEDHYERQRQAEISRSQSLIDTERSKGYEQIRELQRNLRNELKKIRQEGENEIQKLQEHYLNATNSVRMKGDQELRETQSQIQQSQETETRESMDQANRLREMRDQQLHSEMKSTEYKLNQLGMQNKLREEELQFRGEDSANALSKELSEKLEKTRISNTEILRKTENEAELKLAQIRQNTSQKLAAYESQKQDPFYRLLDIQARLEDSGDHYLLRAMIPEHEQKHLSVVMKGNQLVLMGYRKNEETHQLGPGHTQGSSSFQSFHESFPIPWPVESKKITRESQGDQVIIRIPKKTLGPVP